MKPYDPPTGTGSSAATRRRYSQRERQLRPAKQPGLRGMAGGLHHSHAHRQRCSSWEVLAPYSIRPAAAAVLDGYQDVQARKLTIEVVAKVLFNLANECGRSRAETRTLTANQFRNYVKGLM